MTLEMEPKSSATSTRCPEQPQVHSSFTVRSGYLCYGDLHNLRYGATGSVQRFPPPAPEASGTVKVHKLEPCLPALRGIWNAYQLVDMSTQVVHAWMACHSSVDCEQEITKILRISGSPYEGYSGSTFNNAETAAEGVLVINRYDWGLWDERGMKEMGIDEENPVYPPFNVGLVDRENVETQILQWKDQACKDRLQGDGGVWLYLPEAEYLFARFGYDDDHAAARSFLFFTANTYFMRTSFRGLSKSIREDETPEQLFLRALSEGQQFDGIRDWIDVWGVDQAPAASECIGSFNPAEYLFEPEDWDALREYAEFRREETPARPFARTLKENTLALINDLALTCLTRFLEPLCASTSIQELAATLLPRQGSQLDVRSFETHCYSYLTGLEKMTIPGFNDARFESRARNFLIQRCGAYDFLNNSDFMAGLRQYMVYILAELLELAVGMAIGNQHVNTVPSDIRLALFHDKQLVSVFRLCKTFWYGRE